MQRYFEGKEFEWVYVVDIIVLERNRKDIADNFK